MAFNVICDNTQKILLTAAPTYVDPNTGALVPAQIDGPLRVEVQSGDGTFSQDPADPLSFFAISGAGLGDTVYGVSADGDLSPSVNDITETVTLTVSAAPPPPTPQASAFGFTAAAAVPK